MSTAKMLMAKTDTIQTGSPGLLLNLEQEQVQWILVRVQTFSESAYQV